MACQGKEDANRSTNSWNPSLQLFFHCHPSQQEIAVSNLPTNILAPLLLPLLRLLPSQALHREGCGVSYRPGQLPPASQSHVPSQGSGMGMMRDQTFSGLSSARMEERGEGKGRGRDVGDKAGCRRPTSCFFVLCHRDKILFILFCFQFIKRAHFTHTQIKVFP